ncbi:hypothetical protein J1N35_004880 [Gossypium stocksii]|uniref:Uncharacterized protein n=1 Tax=Gossypium stocksii TaxID=47602 RepID=A0A9D3WE97_9ROSI|nr:hypothetical protein J1N35_004880 [Gossypium stocksii]
MSGMLPMVDFATGANNFGSTGGIGRTTKKVHTRQKLDVYMDCAHMGRFARLAVYVDLKKPLVSKVRINAHLQRVEYEALPNICLQCVYVRTCSGRLSWDCDGFTS